MRATVLVAAAALACVACPRATVPTPDVEPPPEADAGPPPIVVPRREGPAVVVLPIQPVGAALFSPELLRLERWVARHLGLQQERVLDPVPPEDVVALRQRLEEGRLREGGPRCLAPIPVRAAVAHAWPDAHRAHVTADCSAGPCRLWVDVVPPDGSEGVFFAAKVRGDGTFADWEAAAQALRRAERPEPRKEEARADAEEGRMEPVVVSKVAAFGSWALGARPDERNFAKSARPALRECHVRGQVPSGPTLLALAFAEDGRLTACDGHGWRDPPRREQLDCYCRALEGTSVGKGQADRRVAVELLEAPDVDHVVSSSERITARIEDFRSSDPAIRQHWLTNALPWVAMCYGQTLLTDELELPVRFVLGERGGVTEAQIGGLERSETLATCVTGYLQNVVMPCPFAGTAELTFTVRVRREQRPPQARPAAAVSASSRR